MYTRYTLRMRSRAEQLNYILAFYHCLLSIVDAVHLSFLSVLGLRSVWSTESTRMSFGRSSGSVNGNGKQPPALGAAAEKYSLLGVHINREVYTGIHQASPDEGRGRGNIQRGAWRCSNVKRIECRARGLGRCVFREVCV